MCAKVKYKNYLKDGVDSMMDDFCSMVLLLKNKLEVKKFFNDFFTSSEKVMLARRLMIAKMLLEGATYEDIVLKLKVGNSTIGNIDGWLNKSFDRYREILYRFNQGAKNEKNFKRDTAGAPISLEYIRKKYPSEYLLLNMLMKKDDEKLE